MSNENYNSSYTGVQIDEGIAAARAARMANGLLKSDGNGNISAAVEGTDYWKDFPSDFKTALLQLASKVAYIDAQGATYYNALLAALYHVTSIRAVYTQSGTVYDTDSLDSLKADLVVTATYVDGSTAIVTSADYTLSGTLAVGTSTITVSYLSFTDTFDVNVQNMLQSMKYYTIAAKTGSDTDMRVTPASNARIIIGANIVSTPMKYADGNTSTFYMLPIPISAASLKFKNLPSVITKIAMGICTVNNGIFNKVYASDAVAASSTFYLSGYNNGNYFAYFVCYGGSADQWTVDISGADMSNAAFDLN